MAVPRQLKTGLAALRESVSPPNPLPVQAAQPTERATLSAIVQPLNTFIIAACSLMFGAERTNVQPANAWLLATPREF